MNTPETMTKHDFSDLTPPAQLVRQWSDLWLVGLSAGADRWPLNSSGNHDDLVATLASRWGAEQAAERLKGQWPEPITDRPPTEADGDEDGYVQVNRLGRWEIASVAWADSTGKPWHHTPRWQPPAPPTLKEQALAAMSRASFSSLSDYELIRRALEADS